LVRQRSPPNGRRPKRASQTMSATIR
jgi:hypothetical protein